MPAGFVPALPAPPARARRAAAAAAAARPSTFGGRAVRCARAPPRARVRMCAAAPKARERFPRDMKPAVRELRSVLRTCPIYLVGPMGSGKSAVGNFLAAELGFRFLDTDELIEAVAKAPVAEIFERDGEEEFRDLETAVLDMVQPFVRCCVATGGGAVLRNENWGKLQTGVVVYLDAPPEVLVERLRHDKTRPLLKDAEDLEKRIREILDQRRVLYEQADVCVPVGAGEGVDDIGMELIRRLTNFIKANPPRLSKLYPGNLPADK